MPQARLPDINTAFVTYRREALNNLKSEKYPMVFGSLFALNALLPEEYRVHISTPEYEKTIKEKERLMAKCKHCPVQTENKDLNAIEVLQTFASVTITGQVNEKIWICTACHKENILGETAFVQEKLLNPSFIKVVPEPPQRHEGLMARNTYHKMITMWVWQLLCEVEEQMAEFRDDNWQKADVFGQDEDYDGHLEAEAV